MKDRFLNLLLISCFITSATYAKMPIADTVSMKKNVQPIRKFYVGTATDAGIFSTATIQHTSTLYNPAGGTSTTTSNTMGIVRFSYVINFGLTFNFNLARHLGVYTGIDLKNIGFIEHNNGGQTVKQRTYNVGAPIGIKIGNMADKGSYLFLGGGMDVAVNYKEKSFSIRNQKTKYNEWFSKATPTFMPYVFAGFAVRNMVSLKLQYYPNNFLNPDYIHDGYKQNYGYNVHLMLLSLGFPMPIGKHKDIVKKHVTDLNTATM